MKVQQWLANTLYLLLLLLVRLELRKSIEMSQSRSHADSSLYVPGSGSVMRGKTLRDLHNREKGQRRGKEHLGFRQYTG